MTLENLITHLQTLDPKMEIGHRRYAELFTLGKKVLICEGTYKGHEGTVVDFEHGDWKVYIEKKNIEWWISYTSVKIL